MSPTKSPKKAKKRTWAPSPVTQNLSKYYLVHTKVVDTCHKPEKTLSALSYGEKLMILDHMRKHNMTQKETADYFTSQGYGK